MNKANQMDVSHPLSILHRQVGSDHLAYATQVVRLLGASHDSH
jgi:hypothetical protein